MSSLQRMVLFLCIPLFLAGCASSSHHETGNKHAALGSAELPVAPSRIVLLPVAMEVKAMGMTNVEVLPDATQKGREILQAEAVTGLEKHFAAKVQVVNTNKLSAAEQTSLDAHAALFEVVVANGLWRQQMPGFPSDKTKTGDYTLGTGLAFIREKTGADYAMLFSGEDYQATGGRVATMVMAAALWGAYIPLGQSYIGMGLVDLRDGRVLWHDVRFSGADMDETSGVRGIIDSGLTIMRQDMKW